MNDELCPKCKTPMEYDEVDIGVGVQRGNYACANPECGWVPRDYRRALAEIAEEDEDA